MRKPRTKAAAGSGAVLEMFSWTVFRSPRGVIRGGGGSLGAGLLIRGTEQTPEDESGESEGHQGGCQLITLIIHVS